MPVKPLKQIRDEIKEVVSRQGLYWHNITAAKLRMIAREYGERAANEAIVDLGLESKGWKTAPGLRAYQ
jgi:hypothetical protein